MIDGAFVGRKDELARFAVLLGEVPTGRRVRVLPRTLRSKSDPADAARSRVVLVHGLGGSGKSRLLRQFREMADGSLPDSPVSPGSVRTIWLDWEDEQRDQPSGYAGADGPSLVTVLDAVQTAVAAAFVSDAKAAERAGQAFGEYRQGAARMPQYAARFADVIAQSRQAGSAFTPGDAAALLKTGASAGLVGIGHPSGILGLTPGQIAGAAQAAGNLSDAAVRAVTGRKPGEITRADYDLVTDPARELTRRVAAAVRSAAGRTPLVLLLDTGEIIGGRAWGWLRRVMIQTGPQVIWVVGARFETEAETGYDSPIARFVRDIGDEHLILMSPTRFDDQMIRDYLARRTTGRTYTGAQIDMIARFTRGLPLAVSLMAQLLGDGEPVEHVCHEGAGHPGTVVSALARRYLIHAERQNYPPEDPRKGDVTEILGLALAFGDLRDDPDLLAVLWDVEDPLAAFQDLARRHDFVLPVSRRLHDDVRDTLRADLLDPYRRTRVREISQRAIGLYNARLTHMRRRWPTLDDQLDHGAFMTTMQAVLWHTLWVDNQAGLDLLTSILPVLEASDPASADAAVAITDWFAGTFTDDQRHDLDLLTYIWDDPFRWPAWESEARRARRARATLPGLALRPPGVAASDPVIGEPADREVAIMILQARRQAVNDGDERAITYLRTAAARTTSTMLRDVIGSEADTIASRLIWPVSGGLPTQTATGLAAAKIATETLTDSAPSWYSYAVALTMADRFEEALAAYDQALTLDPGNATAHHGRGGALQDLGRFEEALAADDQALTLDPGYASAHYGRGVTLQYLGRFEEALAAEDQALTMEPGIAASHCERGTALRYLGRFEEALAAYDRAITLDPGNAHVRRVLGAALDTLGRSREALAVFDQAIALDPDNSLAHTNKGIALAATGDIDAALAELDTGIRLAPSGAGTALAWAAAILWHQGDDVGARDRFARVEGRVTSASPFGRAEMEAVAFVGLGQPDSAEQRLLDALPLRAPGDRAKPRTIYVLLSDPPLTGIDRLRAIVDSGT